MKKRVLLCSVFSAFFVCACGMKTEQDMEETSEESLAEQWEEAETTPLGKYPELVTYTLAKIGIADHINTPEDITYEDNAYTRYLRRILNVQNKDVFETANMSDYTRKIEMMIGNGEELPDVMHITDKNLLDTLVEEDLLEDLSQVYEQCASDLIKDIYSSYGENFLEEYTYDGKLMGFPNTEIDYGDNLLWLRKDWMDELGLEDPETPEEAYDIIRTFAEKNPGSSPEGNVGLAFSLSRGRFTGPSFTVQSIFGLSHAYPGVWILDENGDIIYGSVDENTKAGLAVLRDLYEAGVLDQNFMLRTPENILDLVNSGSCGAVFGPWSIPYGYLCTSRERLGANWQPYLLGNEDGYVTVPCNYSNVSCIVVRKGYEHPEVVPKILTAIYDYSRNEGAEDAEEVNDYHRTCGRSEAMPFVIDVSYKGSLQQTTKQIESVLDGETAYEDASAYIQNMVDKCVTYLNNPDTSVYEWVTYTSRIRAVGELCRAEIKFVNEDCTALRDVDIPGKLVQMEKETFIKIVTGEENMDYFDEFVREWYRNGGEELTRSVNGAEDKNDK